LRSISSRARVALAGYKRMREEFFKALHRRVANTSIGPSTARGMVPRGTVFAARNYLAMIDLGTLKKQTEDEFFELLNKET